MVLHKMFGNSLVDHGLQKLTHDTQKTDWAVLGCMEKIDPQNVCTLDILIKFPGYMEAFLKKTPVKHLCYNWKMLW